MSISAKTKLYGVVGDPVVHSLSPLIQNLWLARHGIDAVYGALHLQTHKAEGDLKALARAGYSGLNITLPHKQAALEAAARRSPGAERIGAANTLVRESDGLWTAHNTDISGFAAAFAEAAPFPLAGRRIVLIGAGGSARAAVAHLKEAGARLAIANRTLANAERLAADLAPDAEIADMTGFAVHAKSCDAIINTASFGHVGGEPPELPAGEGRVFFDLSYGKAAAGMLAAARGAGWSTHDGLAMLVHQAADAFELWHGVTPDRDAAMEAARAEVARR